jgi:hypothetical protein
MRSTPASTLAKRRRPFRHRRPERQGARRRHAALDAARRHVEDRAPRLVADRHRKPSGDAEATGLEVDKYDGEAVRRYLETYLSKYEQAPWARTCRRARRARLVTDSTEVGSSNWTPRLLEQFRRLRGYDARPWLPALTGVVDRQPRPHRRLPVRLPAHAGRPDGQRTLWHRGDGSPASAG